MVRWFSSSCSFSFPYSSFRVVIGFFFHALQDFNWSHPKGEVVVSVVDGEVSVIIGKMSQVVKRGERVPSGLLAFVILVHVSLLSVFLVSSPIPLE